jgi:citrate lyase subunit beta/citryl-CoA lyase
VPPLVSRSGADVIVRINRPIELALRDIETVVSAGVEALMVPKLDSAGHVRLLAERSTPSSAPRACPSPDQFIAMIETAAAFPRMFEIVGTSARRRADAGRDFASSLGAEPDAEMLLYPKQQCVIAARAAGIADRHRLGRELRRRRGLPQDDQALGAVRFEGSACIHRARCRC